MDTIVSVSIELVVLTSSWITSLKDAEQASRTFREVRVPQRFFFFFLPQRSINNCHNTLNVLSFFRRESFPPLHFSGIL